MSANPESENQLKSSKSIAFLNWIIGKIERRAEGAVDKASNHEMISKFTFILVLAMSYELLGERVLSLLALFL